MIIIKQCQACGSILQTQHKNVAGYVNVIDHDICQRCFKLSNYSEISVQDLSYSEFVNQFEKILTSKSLIFYVVDIFDLNNSIISYFKRLKGDFELVILANKKDVLPKLVKEQKLSSYLVNYFNNEHIYFDDLIVVSAKQKINIDEIVDRIYETDYEQVFFVGMANVGKTSIVKECLKQLNIKNNLLITSLPGTTLNQLAFEFENKQIIDTPGIMPENSFLYDIDFRKLKHLLPQKEIKPITFQMNQGNSVMIDDFVIFNYEQGDKSGFQFYFSNSLNLHRFKTINTDRVIDNDLLKSFSLNKKAELEKITFVIPDHHKYDLCVSGIGFVSVSGANKRFSFICPNNIKIEMRRALI